jgi:hypothetical protein
MDRTNDVAVFDNGTFRDSVFYNLLGEEFIPLAVSDSQETWSNGELIDSSNTPMKPHLTSNSTSTTTTSSQ